MCPRVSVCPCIRYSPLFWKYPEYCYRACLRCLNCSRDNSSDIRELISAKIRRIAVKNWWDRIHHYDLVGSIYPRHMWTLQLPTPGTHTKNTLPILELLKHISDINNLGLKSLFSREVVAVGASATNTFFDWPGLNYAVNNGHGNDQISDQKAFPHYTAQ